MKQYRLDKQLAGCVHEVEKPIRVFPKGSGPIGVKFIKEGAPPLEPYVYSIQTVTPKEIGFTIDLKIGLMKKNILLWMSF